MPVSKPTWEKGNSIVGPQINAEGVHVWPFDASFPIDIRFFDVDGGPDIRMNRHDYFELFYACSGKAVCQVQDRRFAIRKGDLVIIGSSLYHRILANHGQSMKAIVLFFQPDLVRAAAPTGEDMQYLMPFFAHDHSFPHVIPADEGIPVQVLDLIQRIHTELPATSNRARLAVKTYLKMILMLLVNHYSAYLGTRETFNRKQSAIQRLRPLFEYLEDHYNEPIRVEDAARICATSSSHFMYFFKRVTGQSFLAYLNHFRVAKAQSLLGSTEKSISEISQEIGFCDQSHFGVVFRKLVGITPLAYRRRFGGVGDHYESFEVQPTVNRQDPPNQVLRLAAATK